jgi:predicted nuclease of restriction endonuclease-like (RecB) superfamily
MQNIDKAQFAQFLTEIKAKIREAQLEALRAVNKYLIDLYWDIGKMIVERQEAHGWGKSVVERLSEELQLAFPGTQGYSVQNLWYMRQFYLEYYQAEILQPLVGEISWTKNVVIMSKCKDELQREFYIRTTRKYGWTKAVLIHQIENNSYEKYLLNQTSFDQTLPEALRNQAKLAVKDEYTFDFLELSSEHSEFQLEQAILKKIRAFLIEMGGNFAFIGNQYRLKVGTKEYSIDLLLFHRKLRCLVAIELKIVEFEPEHKGKMGFYLSVLNDQMKLAEENDAIGIIICKTKDKTVVEYALKSTTQPIGVATYTLTTSLPADFLGLLPSAEDIRERLTGLE